MNLINHIIQILESKHQVTLPSLGKFELVFHSAFLITDKEELLSPDYLVVFSQQHDLNDESFFKEVAILESENQEEIKVQCLDIISEWKDQLKAEKELILNKLGIFTFNKEKILFKMDTNCVFCFKNFGLPTIQNILSFHN